MSLHELGFEIITDCLSEDQCDAILQRLNGVDSTGSRTLLQEPWCRELADALLRKVGLVVPELAKLVAVQCTYFCKSPNRNWFVSWHQDRSIPVADNAAAATARGRSKKEGQLFIQAPDDLLLQMLAVRLHLDDSTEQNGPLRVLPATHLDGILTDTQIRTLQLITAERACCVPKGGSLLMRPLLLHASSKSTSDHPRRVVHFLYGPTQLPNGLKWAQERY